MATMDLVVKRPADDDVEDNALAIKRQKPNPKIPAVSLNNYSNGHHIRGPLSSGCTQTVFQQGSLCSNKPEGDRRRWHERRFILPSTAYFVNYIQTAFN